MEPFAHQLLHVGAGGQVGLRRCWATTLDGLRGERRPVGLGARYFGFRGGFPRRLGRDATGQPLVRALGVVDDVERATWACTSARVSASGCLSRYRKGVRWKRSFLPWLVGM